MGMGFGTVGAQFPRTKWSPRKAGLDIHTGSCPTSWGCHWGLDSLTSGPASCGDKEVPGQAGSAENRPHRGQISQDTAHRGT